MTNDFGTCKVEHPKHLRRAEKRLKKLQKDLSRKQKGSKNYEKVRRRLAKLHTHISNARNDFLHKNRNWQLFHTSLHIHIWRYFTRLLLCLYLQNPSSGRPPSG
ncbi:transposase [Thermocrinis sp.]|uniref:transposase n=1 Tax=Thermocrinis sp. TaxID=2024383 RepID=UPI003BFCAEAC